MSEMKKIENKAVVESVDESVLTEEETRKVDEFIQRIDVSNIKLVNSYGSSVQKSISTFSTTITGTVKTKEFGKVGECLRELRIAIENTVEPERKGIFGLFKRGKKKATYLISNYESSETIIKRIEKDLQKHQQILTKDVYILDQMYDMNLEFYRELTMYIVAGKKALEKARNTQLIELRDKAERINNQLNIHLYRDYESACNRFEKRIFDLELTRLISIQMAPQIRLLQEANQEVVAKLRSDIINTIPLWRNQMVLALGISHTKNALEAQSTMTKMTNEMLRRNAELLKQEAIDAAIVSEKAIVDIETLKKINEEIITSINKVVKIHEEGSRRRIETQEELAKMEEELKNALVEASSR